MCPWSIQNGLKNRRANASACLYYCLIFRWCLGAMISDLGACGIWKSLVLALWHLAAHAGLNLLMRRSPWHPRELCNMSRVPKPQLLRETLLPSARAGHSSCLSPCREDMVALGLTLHLVQRWWATTWTPLSSHILGTQMASLPSLLATAREQNTTFSATCFPCDKDPANLHAKCYISKSELSNWATNACCTNCTDNFWWIENTIFSQTAVS